LQADVPKVQKDTLDLTVFLCFWDLQVKALGKHVGEIDPRCQFHQDFRTKFWRQKSQSQTL